MTVRAMLGEARREIIVAARTDKVAHVVALLAEQRIGCVPVVENGEVLGIFSERDVVHGLAREGASLLERSVEAVMTAPAVIITPDTPVLTALSLMTRRRIRHLPVMMDGRMIGFISIGDLVKYRTDRIEGEAEALRTYIQTA